MADVGSVEDVREASRVAQQAARKAREAFAQAVVALHAKYPTLYERLLQDDED